MNKIQTLESEIISLKSLLNDSDYKALKYAEGIISEEEYEEIKQFRQSLRDKINIIEEEINTLMLSQ